MGRPGVLTTLQIGMNRAKLGRINVTDWHVNFPQPLPGERNARQANGSHNSVAW